VTVTIRHFSFAIVLALLPMLARAQATQPAASTSPLTVGVLNFDSSTAADKELGKQIGDALTAHLSGEDGLRLVERAVLTRALSELELNQSGVIDSQNATKIGKLVGAKLLVTGKAFPLDKQLYLTAKVIGTETSLVESVMVKSPLQSDIGDAVAKLAKQVADKVRDVGPRLVAGDDEAADPMPALVKRLKGRKLPVIAVRIPEHHTASPSSSTPRVDPAVETEVKMLLKEAGFTVVEGDDKELARAGVEVVLNGEAFSEFAARIGNLVSCAARIEVKLTPLAGGEVKFVDRETTKAADLSEGTAAKTALQKGGRTLALRLLEHFASQPAAAPKAGEAQAAPASTI
jgi:hypothetical protein